MKNIDLIIIDPQNDFCHEQGALYVEGANEDMIRLFDMLSNVGQQFRNIHVSLDTHRYIDIAHPLYWKDLLGVSPDPFTIITLEDVEDAKWRTQNPNNSVHAISYLKQLTLNNKYPLCIWPPHCLLGSWGHIIETYVYDELLEWEALTGKLVNYIMKGENPDTEHYSVIKADVPIKSDPLTDVNHRLLQEISSADMLVIAGEASSHCVANTVRDIIEYLGDNYAKKIVLLEDCMSPVSGFEKLETDFLNEVFDKGVKQINSIDFLN